MKRELNAATSATTGIQLTVGEGGEDNLDDIHCIDLPASLSLPIRYPAPDPSHPNYIKHEPVNNQITQYKMITKTME